MTAAPRVLAPGESVDRPTRWPLVAHRVVGAGAVSDYADDTVATPDGEQMHRQYLLHPGAVAVIALDEADRVVVVRQYRHPVGFQLIEPPAGLLDVDDESYLSAAQRELAEEAMLAADDWRLLIDMFTSPGCNSESIRFFLARGLREVPRPDGFVVEHEELDMDVCLVPLADLVDNIYAGQVQSPTLVAGVLALEAARRSGRLADLRPADSPWPARDVRQQHLDEIAKLA
ncbi:NUDIX domain-containing protein [Micropruina sp.]|uniref:NUDIX domain-containing protein n=1 Tax=Micropruina sp. TaxID=2737536 RepID=UPI0039E572F8